MYLRGIRTNPQADPLHIVTSNPRDKADLRRGGGQGPKEPYRNDTDRSIGPLATAERPRETARTNPFEPHPFDLMDPRPEPSDRFP